MFDFVATAAPGVKEILTVGKIAYEVRERNYDLVVVDASASGHVVGQLASPVALGELISVGVVQAQTPGAVFGTQGQHTAGDSRGHRDEGGSRVTRVGSLHHGGRAP